VIFFNLGILIAALVILGTLSYSAYADPGNVEITDIFVQGGISFDVLDPDGLKSVTLLPNANCQLETQDINLSCLNPQTTFFELALFCINPQGDPPSGTFQITDCQADMETETWFIQGPNPGTANCNINCFLRSAVGGEFIGIDSTMVLVAGTQNTAAWMIPAVVSAIGIGIVIARKF